jgi:hypothetical protein
MCRRLSGHGTKHDCVGLRLCILFWGEGVSGSNLGGGPVIRTVLSVSSPFFQTNAAAMARLVHSRRRVYLFHFTNHPTTDSLQNRQRLKIANKLR